MKIFYSLKSVLRWERGEIATKIEQAADKLDISQQPDSEPLF